MNTIEKTLLTLGMVSLCLFCTGFDNHANKQADFVKIRGGLPHISLPTSRYMIRIFGKNAYPVRSTISRKVRLPASVDQFWPDVIIPESGALGIAYYSFGSRRLTYIALLDTFVNDLSHNSDQIKLGLQCMWNRIPASTDVILVYSPPSRAVNLKTYEETLKIYEDFAEKHNIPSIDLNGYIQYLNLTASKAASDINFRHQTSDTKKYHRLIADAADDLLAVVIRHSLNQQLTKEQIHDIETVRSKSKGKAFIARLSYELDSYPEGWMPWQLSPIQALNHVLVGCSTKPYTIDFFGEAIGILGIATNECGDFEFSIDGAPFKIVKSPVVNSGYEYYEYLLESKLSPKSKHTLKIKCANPNKKLIIGAFFVVNFRGTRPVNKNIDYVYSKIPKLNFTPKQSILEKLPKTKAKLKNGDTLSILLLGDSIVYGISQSNFEQLIQYMYPNCKIIKQTSLRGSTGCWYYKQPENFQEYIGNKKFDLLMIGGISHHNDIESIESVVKQTLAAKSDAEIILMTDAWGYLNFNDVRFDRSPEVSDSTYQGRLLKLAESFPERVAFMDITTPWASYLRNCGVPYSVFKLDSVHANRLGDQLLARIIEAYFAPEGYNPLKEFEKRINDTLKLQKKHK